MNEHKLWDSVKHPIGLADMVHVGWVQRLLRSAEWMGFPGPEPDLVVHGQTRVEARARRVFDKFVELGIEYVAEPTDSEPGAQRIRPVNEVLAFRKATCIDLCVAFCCAALDAGIYPLILTVTADRGLNRHAIVLVPLDRVWANNCGALLEMGFSRELLEVDGEALGTMVYESEGDPSGTWLAIDVQQVTEVGANWGAALSSGAQYIRDWEWDVCVDVGGLRSRTPDRELPPGGHIEKVLAPAYAALPEDFTPLQLIKARHGVVPYQQCAEMRQLREWAMTVPSDIRTGRIGRNADISVAVVTGAGGSGKTRMAAQLCHDLSTIGWYTGFLPSTTEVTDEELAALAEVTTEVLVVVDYAEEARRGLVARVVRKLRARHSPTRIVLTARGADTWWEEFREEAEQDGTPLSNTLSLSIRGKQQVETDPWFFGRMYRRAVRQFSDKLNRAVPTDVEVPEDLGDTALDVVLRTWLAVCGNDEAAKKHMPTREELYDRVLSIEFARWCKEPELRGISRDHLRRAAATLSLLAPSQDEDAVDDVLSRLPEWSQDHLLRSRFAALLVQSLLRDDGAEFLSLRPDPVAEHLILEVFGKKPELLDRVLPQDPVKVPGLDDIDAEDSVVTRALEWGQQARNACVALTRAASRDSERARLLACRALRLRPVLWREALDISISRGGPFARALTVLIESGADLPLDEIDNAIPVRHSALGETGLATTKRLAAAAEQTIEQRAYWAQRLSIRLSDVGAREQALEFGREAVELYESLVKNFPGDYEEDLAAALDHLAANLNTVGEYREALVAGQKSVDLYRRLFSKWPESNTRDLAIALTNLAKYRLDAGELGEALAAAQEAVDLQRCLPSESMEKYTLDLAMSLLVFANCLSLLGEKGKSVEAACEAKDLIHELFDESKASYAAPLAKSLDTLSHCLLESGDPREALKTAREAERLHRWLDKEAPGSHMADLAYSLKNIADCLLENDEVADAITACCEAEGLYWELRERFPQMHVPGLAASLNIRANCLSRQRKLGEALDVGQESVDLFRRMSKDNPISYKSDLAMSLSNLSRHLWRVNENERALDAAREAADLRRDLSKKFPAAFNSDLAASLSGLAIRLSSVGEFSEALAKAREAVDLYRTLEKGSPDIYKSKLAASLNSLANRLVENGDRGGASEAFNEGVCLYRKLVEESSDMYKPELAMMITNMAENLSSIGDNEGALRAVLEGVDLYRGLAKESPDHYRPDLARALNSLACGWLGAGNSVCALEASREALVLYRSLAAESPAAYSPRLAEALSICANLLLEGGELNEALEASREAVVLCRSLAAESPAAYSPRLADALSICANILVKGGKLNEALEASREAVDLFRSSADVLPAAYSPRLAEALNTRAYILSLVGDRRGALNATQESLDLYRRLDQVSPEVYTVKLALALNNHANTSWEMDEHECALKSAFEAADLFRMLVLKDRVSHCQNLAGVLQNLARILAMSDRLEEALGVFVKGFDTFSPGVRAHLLLSRASGRGDGHEADDVVAAAWEADATDVPELLGPVRRGIAQAMADMRILNENVPVWAIVSADSVMVSRVKEWSECKSLAERADLLEKRWASPSNPEREMLAALVQLHIDLPSVAELAALVERGVVEGMQAVSTDLRVQHYAQVLGRDWYEAHTGGQGVRFLREHMRADVGAPREGGGNDAAMKTDSAKWDRDLSDSAMRSAVLDVLAAELPDAEATRLGLLLELADLSDPATAYEAYGSDEGAEDSLRHFLESHNWRAMVAVLGVRPSVADSAHGRIAALLDAAVGGESTERLRELYEYANEAMDAIDRRHLQTLLDQALRTRQCSATFANIRAWIKRTNS